MALPKLPGYDFNAKLGQEKFHKSHHFDKANKVTMWVGKDKPGIGGIVIPGQDVRQKNSIYARGDGNCLPAWVAFDKQVLAFDAYYQEAVTEKREEQYRVRKCKVYFYLEDDSIQVVEPRMKNSQLPQGTLIKRHRIPKPPPCDDVHYTIDDFNIGRQLSFYGKTFKLTDCDEFTRNFLTKIGMVVCPKEGVPEDPYSTVRKALDESMQPFRPYERKDTLKQFLDCDRQVLRFYCYWDDRGSLYGDEHDLILHYFLADDTVEIREVLPPNAGTDATPILIRRGRLPKVIEPIPEPGKVTERTVLNVFGGINKGRYILDSLRMGAYQQNYYTDSDLTIGAALNAYGRKILVTDCDEFTKHYYNTKYGITSFQALNVKSQKPGMPEREWPPYHGFGSEEDSLTSCQLTLQPKPPQRDFIKFMEKDRCGFESHVLRFLAKMVTDKPQDVDRRFIVSYFLSDDTILIFEPASRNSGHKGGTFQDRQRIKRPNQPRYRTTLSEYYKAQDLHVGAVLNFNEFIFQLLDADEYCFTYMEKHYSEFPMASVEMVKNKLREALKEQESNAVEGLFTKHAPLEDDATITYAELRCVVDEIMGPARKLSEHEVMTLARGYGMEQESQVDTSCLVYLIQEDLRRDNYDIYANRVHEALQQRDAAKTGKLPQKEVLNVLKCCHIPMNRVHMEQLVACMLDEEGLIDYNEIMKHLNWKEFPVPAPRKAYKSEKDATGADKLYNLGIDLVRKAQARVRCINHKLLYNDIKPDCPVYPVKPDAT